MAPLKFTEQCPIYVTEINYSLVTKQPCKMIYYREMWLHFHEVNISHNTKDDEYDIRNAWLSLI